MSWNVNITSKDKEALKAAIRTEQHMPRKLKEMLCDQVNVHRLPDPFEKIEYAIRVASTGHHDQSYYYGDFRVELTRAV